MQSIDYVVIAVFFVLVTYATWPEAVYRAQDFRRTEDLIHRFVVIPVGMTHTEADEACIADVIRRAQAELGMHA